MSRPTGILIVLCAALLVALPVHGEEQSEDAIGLTAGSEVFWSTTVIADFDFIDTEDGPDDVGDFFDQYDFTPNKSETLPIQLGVRDAAFDLIDARDTPILQIRFASPTSNLGVSGSEIDDPFFNQRLDAYGRRRGLAMDLHYRRMRTEQLRLFPNTEGGALLFSDLTDTSDRFTRDRTGFETELRFRPLEAFEVGEDRLASRLAPEISFRGGYEDRDGLAQRRFLRSPTSNWLGLPQQMERSVSNLGGALSISPWDLMTLTLDFDHERFRWDSAPVLDGDLGFGPPGSLQTVGFVPNTNQSTGRVLLSSRIGERVRLEGGLQLTHLEQTGDVTPDQSAAGLKDNSVITYSANAAVDVQLSDDLSLETLFKFDRRNNDIDRDTVLFNPTNGTQTDEFVRNWRRYVGGAEFVYRMRGANRLAVGARYEEIQRDIEFAQPGPTNRRILPANALIDQETRMATVYGRAALKPLRGLSLSAEIGYRDAPRTGYIVDLDDYVYGKLRTSYVIPVPRLVVVSAYVRGSTGRNRDFDQVSGLGPRPAGPALARNFDRTSISWGLTMNASPRDDLSLFASLFFDHDDQNHSLAVSNFPRYFQDLVAIDFANTGTTRFENRQMSLILGGRFRFAEKTDGSLQYAFTRAESRYDDVAGSIPLQSISANRRIDSDTHGIHLQLRHELRQGLRVLVGYGLRIHEDDTRVPQSVASVVAPFDRSTLRHRVSLGVTLTQGLFEKAD